MCYLYIPKLEKSFKIDEAIFLLFFEILEQVDFLVLVIWRDVIAQGKISVFVFPHQCETGCSILQPVINASCKCS